MTTLFAPQLAARARTLPRGVRGYCNDDDVGLGATNPRRRAFGVRSNSPLPPPAALPVYAPPDRVYRGVYNGVPSSLLADEIIAKTQAGRFVLTTPPPRPGANGQPIFGGDWQAHSRIWRDRLDAQFSVAFPGDRITDFIGRPEQSSLVRNIGMAATIAAPILGIVAPYAAPAAIAIAAATRAQQTGGNVVGSALTASIGSALTAGAPGGSMNFGTLLNTGATGAGGIGGLASGIANSFGASNNWANVIGGIAGGLPALFGGGGGTPAPAAPTVLPPPPRVEVTSRDGVLPAASNTPLIIGVIVLAALLLGGKRR